MLVRLGPTTARALRSGATLASTTDVVCALVQNSLEAGAREVCVSVRLGEDIRIVCGDDGEGIGRQGLDLVGERYCTGKNGCDRTPHSGESLHAIVSLAERCVVRSKVAGSEGYDCVFANGRKVGIVRNIGALKESAACGSGTTITIDHLFYRLSVRRRVELSRAAVLVGELRMGVAGVCMSRMGAKITVHVEGSTQSEFEVDARGVQPGARSALAMASALFGAPWQDYEAVKVEAGGLRVEMCVAHALSQSCQYQWIVVNGAQWESRVLRRRVGARFRTAQRRWRDAALRLFGKPFTSNGVWVAFVETPSKAPQGQHLDSLLCPLLERCVDLFFERGAKPPPLEKDVDPTTPSGSPQKQTQLTPFLRRVRLNDHSESAGEEDLLESPTKRHKGASMFAEQLSLAGHETRQNGLLTSTDESAFAETSSPNVTTALQLPIPSEPSNLQENLRFVLSKHTLWEKSHANGVCSKYFRENKQKASGAGHNLPNTKRPVETIKSPAFCPTRKCLPTHEQNRKGSRQAGMWEFVGESPHRRTPGRRIMPEMASKPLSHTFSGLSPYFGSTSLPKAAFRHLTVIGQCDAKYIITRWENTLVALDQHGCDERVRLETLLTQLATEALTPPPPTRLRKHVTLLLSSQERHLAQEYGAQLNRWGVRISGGAITHLPLLIHDKPPAAVAAGIRQYLHDLSVGGKRQVRTGMALATVIQNAPQLYVEIAKSRACKTALTFGHQLSVDECQRLINSLSTCHTPHFCAHGRLIAIVLNMQPLSLSNA